MLIASAKARLGSAAWCATWGRSIPVRRRGRSPARFGQHLATLTVLPLLLPDRVCDQGEGADSRNESRSAPIAFRRQREVRTTYGPAPLALPCPLYGGRSPGRVARPDFPLRAGLVRDVLPVVLIIRRVAAEAQLGSVCRTPVAVTLSLTPHRGEVWAPRPRPLRSSARLTTLGTVAAHRRRRTAGAVCIEDHGTTIWPSERDSPAKALATSSLMKKQASSRSRLGRGCAFWLIRRGRPDGSALEL